MNSLSSNTIKHSVSEPVIKTELPMCESLRDLLLMQHLS